MSREADRAWRRARYQSRKDTGEYLYSEWALTYLCRQNDMIACEELDRRERHAKATGKSVRVAHEILKTARERRADRIENEAEKIRGLSPAKKKSLIAEYKKERKAHPTLTGDVILQIARDHIRMYDRKKKRKRWSRKHKE